MSPETDSTILSTLPSWDSRSCSGCPCDRSQSNNWAGVVIQNGTRCPPPRRARRTCDTQSLHGTMPPVTVFRNDKAMLLRPGLARDSIEQGANVGTSYIHANRGAVSTYSVNEWNESPSVDRLSTTRPSPTAAWTKGERVMRRVRALAMIVRAHVMRPRAMPRATVRHRTPSRLAGLDAKMTNRKGGRTSLASLD